MPPSSAPRRRIAILGAGARRKTEASLTRAARELGHAGVLLDVVRLTQWLGRLAHAAIERRVDAFAPDIVILTRHAWLLGEARLRRLLTGRHAVMWHVDAVRWDGVIELGRLAGRMYLTCPGHLADYRALGVPDVRFLPQGLDPTWDAPVRRATPGFACDVSFIGSGQYPHRWPLLKAVAGAAALQIRGPGWEEAPPDLPWVGGPVHGRRFAAAVAGARVSLGARALPETDTGHGAFSNRLWKVLGTGGCYLGPWTAGMDHFARDGEHCLWFRNTEDAVDRIHWALAHPDDRARIAADGRAHALAHHTYRHRLELILADREYEIP